MARPTNTDERRAQIIRGLQKVMATRGYERASIRDIAKAARLTQGLVHYHFRAKHAVLEALVEAMLARHLERLDAALDAAGLDPFDRVCAFCDFHLAAGASADPEALAVWVALSAEAVTSAAVRARFAQALGALRDRLHFAIADGQRKRVFVRGDSAAFAVALGSVIEGYFVIAATARELIPPRSAAPAVRRMAEGLLLPRRRSSRLRRDRLLQRGEELS